MKSNLYTIVYAAVLGLVCALALTAMEKFTFERKEANKKAEEIRNILGVLDAPFDPEATAEELVKTAAALVTKKQRGGRTYHVYEHPQHGTLWATEFAGPGLWGPIEGFLCLKGDLRTIHAISFYKHEETPGMGGRISSDAFQDSFKGKDILAGVHLVPKGRADTDDKVDAITGATMTSDKVQDILNALQKSLAEQEDSNGE